MKWRHLQFPIAIAAAAALAGCGGSTNTNPASASATLPVLVPVTGISAAVTYSFDLGQIDTGTGMYYVTDRTNKAIDVINLSGGAGNVSLTPATLFKQAFAGCNSGGTTGGQANAPYVPMPGCLNIAITANATLVLNNDLSGPDGLDIVVNDLFAGDVNALWVINKTSGALLGKVAIANTGAQQGFRSDEGCYDPVNHLYATALTADPNTPFYTILDTTAHDSTGVMPVLIGYVLMNGPDGKPAGGLEGCAFETRGFPVGTGIMWQNNDGTTANPHGELNGIPIEDMLAMKTTPIGGNKMAVFSGPAAGPFVQFPVGGVVPAPAAAQCTLGAGGACGPTAGIGIAQPPLCDGTGIALGPTAGIVAAMCRPGTFGHSLDFLVINTNTAPRVPAAFSGVGVTVVAGAGGGDQITYDAKSNKYYLANSRATANGKSCFSGSTQACNLTPKLTVVDGTTNAVVAAVDSGNNAHSVAVGNGMVIMPFTNTSATAGGANFPNGGVAVYPTF